MPRVKGKDINTKIARKADIARGAALARSLYTHARACYENCIYIPIYDSIKMSHLPLAAAAAYIYSFENIYIYTLWVYSVRPEEEG